MDGNGNRRPLPERNRYGVCIIKIASNTPPPPVPNNNRRNQDRQNTHVLTPRGGILFGSQCNPQLIQRGIVALLCYILGCKINFIFIGMLFSSFRSFDSIRISFSSSHGSSVERFKGSQTISYLQQRLACHSLSRGIFSSFWDMYYSWRS